MALLSFFSKGITGNALGADEPELDVICQLNELFHARFCVLTPRE
jgi:hypothetical protein